MRLLTDNGCCCVLLQNFLGLGGGCTVEIEMADAATRKCLSIRRGAAGSAGGEAAELCPLYAHRETVSGEVHVNVPPVRQTTVEHQYCCYSSRATK
eukprot:scaffold2926_cov399-Prasinococcus_capsulatus_cf.AAC.5